WHRSASLRRSTSITAPRDSPEAAWSHFGAGRMVVAAAARHRANPADSPGLLGYAARRMTQSTAPAWENPAFVAVHCFACGEPHDRRTALTVCRACGLPLRVDYDHEVAPLAPAALVGRPPSLWRYREVLPIRPEHAVSLVEGWTPLCEIGDRLFVKDESRNPT